MLPRSYHGDDLRKWQIDTLKIFNDHVNEVQENAEYRIEFTAAGQNMCLNVLLGPDFPNTQPNIFIHPPVPHPWIAENSNQIVGAPGLLNYTIHSDLGRVVQAIIREFKKTIVLDNVPPPMSGPLLFPELMDLNSDELQEILQNTDLQDKLLETNQHLVQLDLETEKLMNSIEEIAQENLAKRQMLDTLKTEVVDKISSIVKLKMSYEELNRKHQQLSDMFEPHKIRDCLREAALKADEEAEVIADQFLTGNIPVDMFVEKFAEKRALGQARRAREERLAHQLAQLDLATS